MNTATATPIDAGLSKASELLDVLYEILASGLEPESATVSVSDIETFLHQHARTPKTRPEIEAFFVSGGLPTHVDALSRDSGLRLTAVATHTVSASSGELRAPESHTGRHLIEVSAKAASPTISVPSAPVIEAMAVRRGMSGTSMVLAGVCFALLSACVVGGWSMLALRDDLARAQATQQHTLAMLERVQARNEQLGLQLSAQSNALADQRAEVDRLVQTFSLEVAPE